MGVLVARTGRELQRYNDEGGRLVVGCIPYRMKGGLKREDDDDRPCSNNCLDNEMEVLLITSQKGGDAIMFPKGGWEKDESEEAAVQREAEEEAGVKGIVEASLGKWSFLSKRYGKMYDGLAFPLRVTKELDHWAEEKVRGRRWVTVAEARQLCQQWWMKEALEKFVNRISDAKSQMEGIGELVDDKSIGDIGELPIQHQNDGSGDGDSNTLPEKYVHCDWKASHISSPKAQAQPEKKESHSMDIDAHSGNLEDSQMSSPEAEPKKEPDFLEIYVCSGDWKASPRNDSHFVKTCLPKTPRSESLWVQIKSFIDHGTLIFLLMNAIFDLIWEPWHADAGEDSRPKRENSVSERRNREMVGEHSSLPSTGSGGTNAEQRLWFLDMCLRRIFVSWGVPWSLLKEIWSLPLSQADSGCWPRSDKEKTRGFWPPGVCKALFRGRSERETETPFPVFA